MAPSSVCSSTIRAAHRLDQTDDVDVLIDASSRRKYDAVTQRLLGLGFRPDTSEGAPLCRWVIDGVIVDVMPTSPEVLGFSNRWYADAMIHAVTRQLEPGLSIRIASAPYFIAMKLEAFHGRGNGDFAASHDLEDLIAVIDGYAPLAELSALRCLKRRSFAGAGFWPPRLTVPVARLFSQTMLRSCA